VAVLSSTSLPFGSWTVIRSLPALHWELKKQYVRPAHARKPPQETLDAPAVAEDCRLGMTSRRMHLRSKLLNSQHSSGIDRKNPSVADKGIEPVMAELGLSRVDAKGAANSWRGVRDGNRIPGGTQIFLNGPSDMRCHPIGRSDSSGE
jgi:hypothetical protein